MDGRTPRILVPRGPRHTEMWPEFDIDILGRQGTKMLKPSGSVRNYLSGDGGAFTNPTELANEKLPFGAGKKARSVTRIG